MVAETKQEEKKEVVIKGGGRNLPISFKYSVEVANWIKGRTVKQAMTLLKEVLEFKKAVPVRRYNKDCPHKPGIGPGKYPIKVCKVFLALLKNIVNNAKIVAGIDDPSKILIKKIEVNRAVSKHKNKRGIPKMTHVFIECVPIEGEKQK